MVYKSLHVLTLEYPSSELERPKTTNKLRDTKNSLNVPSPRTNYYKNSFSYSGVIL